MKINKSCKKCGKRFVTERPGQYHCEECSGFNEAPTCIFDQ